MHFYISSKQLIPPFATIGIFKTSRIFLIVFQLHSLMLFFISWRVLPWTVRSMHPAFSIILQILIVSSNVYNSRILQNIGLLISLESVSTISLTLLASSSKKAP
jgi:hypothetical protein